MRIGNILIGALLPVALAGCAHDSYTVLPDGPGSQGKMHADVLDCKHQTLDAYFAQRSNTGAITGALLGGAVGGAIGGAMDASSNEGKMQTSDMKPLIEDCMRQKGYEANVDNSP